MRGISVPLASFARSLPRVADPRDTAFVEHHCPARAVARIQDACVYEKQRNERNEWHRQPRRATAAKGSQDGNAGKEQCEPHPSNPGVRLIEPLQLQAANLEPISIN